MLLLHIVYFIKIGLHGISGHTTIILLLLAIAETVTITSTMNIHILI